MFALNMPRLDVAALIMLVALPFAGVFTMGEALAGFSDSNIVLIAALFVIGEGLVRTGTLIATAPNLIVNIVRQLVASKGTQKRHKGCDFERQLGGPDGNALGGF